MNWEMITHSLPGHHGAGREELKAVCLLPAGVQRVDEGGWNTVQGTKNSRVLDPTKFLKITKVGASTGLIQSNKVLSLTWLHLSVLPRRILT